MDVILNSYHFFDDVLPATLRLLANQETENPLFEAIAYNRHRILVTDRSTRPSMMKECQRQAKSGLVPQLLVAMDQLRDLGLITIDRSAPRRPIDNLGGPHSVFLEAAVTLGVQYFITEYDPWLRLNRNRRICPGLSILPASRFIRAAHRLHG